MSLGFRAQQTIPHLAGKSMNPRKKYLINFDFIKNSKCSASSSAKAVRLEGQTGGKFANNIYDKELKPRIYKISKNLTVEN